MELSIGTLCGRMICKLGFADNYEFDAHWAPYTSGLVPNLAKSIRFLHEIVYKYLVW